MGRRAPSNLLPVLVDTDVPPVPCMISCPVATFSRAMLRGTALAGVAGSIISLGGGGCREKATTEGRPGPNAVDEKRPSELRLREDLWTERGGFCKGLLASWLLRHTVLYLARHKPLAALSGSCTTWRASALLLFEGR